MALIKYLQEHGNTQVLLLPKSILELLKLGDVGNYVKIETDGKNIIIEPATEKEIEDEEAKHVRTYPDTQYDRY